jgi:hypothetical protein
MNRLFSISVVLLSTALVACGGGGAKGGAKVFTAADLSSLVLQQGEAPGDAKYSSEGSGPQSLDDFAEDAAEKAKLTEFGFTGAHTAAFVSPGLFEAQSVADIPPNARLVVSVVVAFRDGENAEKALDYLKSTAFNEAKGARQLAASGLGEKAFGLSFDSLDPSTPLGGFAFGWQSSNVVLTVIGAGLSGSTKEAEVRALAEKMDSRI